GGDVGGGVEVVLVRGGGGVGVGVGADHTDRAVETYGVTVSKQMCDKPVAPVFWAFDDVAPHWDQLMLRACVIESGERKIYQEGPVAAMLKPLDLIGRCALSSFRGELGTDRTARRPESALMFCGPLAALGGVRPTGRFEFEVEDPVLGRSIAHAYSVRILPVVG